MGDYLGKESLRAINDTYIKKTGQTTVSSLEFKKNSGKDGCTLSVIGGTADGESSIEFFNSTKTKYFSVGFFSSQTSGSYVYPSIWHPQYGIQIIATEKWVRDNYGSSRSNAISTQELKEILGGGVN